MTIQKIIVVLLLFIGASIKAAAHPVIDSFINANTCFFVKHGLFSERIKSFKLFYKDFYPDSSSVQRRYKSWYWIDQCKIYEEKKSNLAEDITDVRALDMFRCEKVNWLKRMLHRKKVVVYRLPPIKEGDYTYYYYVLHHGISYIHVIFKLKENQIVRFCYHLAIT